MAFDVIALLRAEGVRGQGRPQSSLQGRFMASLGRG